MMTIDGTYQRAFSWTFVLALLVAWPSQAQELPLGSAMPMANTAFSNVQGGDASLSSLAGESGTVVAFWSNQCPWVERYESRFNDIVEEFAGRGFGFVLVNSNDVSAYPRESADESAQHFRDAGYPNSVAYLSDPNSQLAEAFGAERTPHMYVFDGDGALVYVGTIDDSPGDPGSVEEQYLRAALNAVGNGSNVAVPRTKAFGCTIRFAG